MLLVGSLFDVSLFFYILHIRIIEPKLFSIPFSKKEMTLSVVQRNVLTLTFALLGVIFLVMITLNPANLASGTAVVYKRLSPIIIYSVAYFAVATYLLTADIIKCLRQIGTLTSALSKKNYTIEDQNPEHRSELGVILQGINAFKNQAADILRQIDNSTKKTVSQSDDLVHNMDLTKDNVANIVESISTVKEEIENQLGFELIWDRLDNKKASRIKHTIPGLNFDDHSNYDKLMNQIIDIAVKMRDVFKKYL